MWVVSHLSSKLSSHHIKSAKCLVNCTSGGTGMLKIPNLEVIEPEWL
jgi:hypothetical protein